MNKLKHTKGPWKLTVSRSNKSYSIHANCEIVYVQRDPIVLLETWERQLADARLIAAAPEMLDLLARLYVNYELPYGLMDAQTKKDFHKVLEKATGIKKKDYSDLNNKKEDR